MGVAGKEDREDSGGTTSLCFGSIAEMFFIEQPQTSTITFPLAIPDLTQTAVDVAFQSFQSVQSNENNSERASSTRNQVSTVPTPSFRNVQRVFSET
jgi:hypothetical protein